ncbi:2-C-methyl-D-erythritol 4-phosphate cytidylyltransferase [bacterium]|nr:2-C-methyl-D-erythritol 4-phosphate cytidylyltransferase [bacterium]
MKRGIIIVAGGIGTRFKGNVPKAFIELDGKSLLAHCAGVFENMHIDEMAVAVPEGYITHSRRILSDFGLQIIIVVGGKTRVQSMRAAFFALGDKIEVVGVHDVARPLLHPESAEAVFLAAEKYGAATLGLPVSDTLKSIEDGFILNTVPRDNIWAMQTPQVFHKKLLKHALHQNTEGCTDDCSLIEQLNEKIFLVEGKRTNIKITYPEDLQIAESIINLRK